MRYALYKDDGTGTRSGRIGQIGTCPMKAVPLQAREGWGVIACPAGVSGMTHKVVNGRSTPLAAEELQARKAEMEAFENPVPRLSRQERMFVELALQGFNLGPAGDYLQKHVEEERKARASKT